MRHDHAHHSVIVQRRNHVLHESQIARILGWRPVWEAAKAVVVRFFFAPRGQTERRIGDHAIKVHQLAMFDVLRLAQGIAFAYVGIEDTMQKHIHLADGPGIQIHFLAV